MKTSYGEFDRVEDLSQMNCGDPSLYIKGAVRLASRELKKGESILIIVPSSKWNMDQSTLEELVTKNNFIMTKETQNGNIILKMRKM